MSRSILTRMIALLGTELIGSHESPIGLNTQFGTTTIIYHSLHPELCTTPQSGESSQEEILVEGIAVMLPYMAAVPGIGHEIVVSPKTHATENIVLGKACPSILHSSIFPGGSLPVVPACHVDYIVDEGQMQFTQIGWLGWPIVHLNIDIGMDI